jgi:hypothetical protein
MITASSSRCSACQLLFWATWYGLLLLLLHH